MKKYLILFFVLFLAACTTTSNKGLTDAEKVALDKTNLSIVGDLSNVKNDLILPTLGENGSTITWASSNTNVILVSGKVIRPAHDSGDATVKLTATLTLKESTDTKEFSITVKALEVAQETEVCPGLPNPSEYEIVNKGFESGNLCGWTTEGEAFKNEGVTDTTTFYDSTFARDGSYHFSTWAQGGEETVGKMTSSLFELGGTGWITFKLGGGKNSELIYISVVKEDGTEIARYGNRAFVDNVNQAAQLIQYKADLSAYVGEKLSIVVVDNATSDWGIVTLDSMNTYYTEVTSLPESTLALNLLVGDINAPTVVVTEATIEVNSTNINWNQYVTATDDFDDQLTVTFNTDTLKLNELNNYIVTVTVTDDNSNKTEKNITVHVVDTTKPVLTLQENVRILSGSTDVNFEEFITVTDFDQNPTISVNSDALNINELGEYSVIYTVTDQSGNSSEITLLVTIIDANAPVISGTHHFKIELGSTAPNYLEGVTASDSTDGDLTQFVTVDSSAVRLDEVGIYDVIYSVVDSDLQTTTITVKIEIYVFATEIVNGNFETGDLTGWTTTGTAFANNGIVNDGENNSSGYYFKPWNVGETNTGTLKSSDFKLSGSGYITFMLGAAKHQNEVYLSVYTIDGTEVARYSNVNFDNNGYAYLYKADLTAYLGQKLYLEVVDNAQSDWGLIVLDEFKTYYETESLLPENATLAHNMVLEEPSIYQINNGGFETGDFTGWVATGVFNNSYVLSIEKYNLFGGEYTYNKEGFYYYTGKDHEGETGTLTSSTFTLGGTGVITFKLGGAQPKNPEEIYVSVYKEDGTEIARYQRSGDTFPTDGNLVPQLEMYKADLSQYIGERLYIKVVDNATSGWGWLTLDAFETYYTEEVNIPQSTTAINLL